MPVGSGATCHHVHSVSGVLDCASRGLQNFRVSFSTTISPSPYPCPSCGHPLSLFLFFSSSFAPSIAPTPPSHKFEQWFELVKVSFFCFLFFFFFIFFFLYHRVRTRYKKANPWRSLP